MIIFICIIVFLAQSCYYSSTLTYCCSSFCERDDTYNLNTIFRDICEVFTIAVKDQSVKFSLIFRVTAWCSTEYIFWKKRSLRRDWISPRRRRRFLSFWLPPFLVTKEYAFSVKASFIESISHLGMRVRAFLTSEKSYVFKC